MNRIVRLLPPHPLQREIENDQHRFRVVACGRRWGKTLMAMREAFQMMLKRYVQTGRKQRGWVVAPTFSLVGEDWLEAEKLLTDAIVDKNATKMKMVFDVGTLEFKSAEREDEGLRGAGLDFCVVDEASRVSKKSWESGIRPALSDKLGKAIFISTPKGRNWFYEMFRRGQDNDPEIKSWQHPTYTNPFFPLSEWELIKKTTPEMILKQEYLADFLEDEATVFHNLTRCLRGRIEEPIDKEYYTIGVDLAKAEDFTVAVVVRNSTAQVIEVYRQNQVDWSLQKKQIIALTNRFKNSLVYIDSTGLGDPIEEDLRKSGINTKDYKFTNQSKQELIEQLIVAIEQGLIGIPDCPQTQFLIDELKSFSYEILPSRRIRYQAPEGLHDDGVIALGLSIIGIPHLLYKQSPKVDNSPKQNTADWWENYYRMIDNVQKKNPFLSREQAYNQLRLKRWRRLVRV
jgi:hypothetical protein